MTWRKCFGLILIAVLLLLLIPSLITADPSPDPPSLHKIPLALRVKIEPQVLKELAFGKKTTYIVHLVQQADLAPVRRIQEKLTRRQAVVSTLQAVAERSQRGIRAYLDGQQASGHVEGYIPFWVFNGLAVTGDLETLLALAARPEVEVIRANHTHQLPNPRSKLQTSNFQPFGYTQGRPPISNTQYAIRNPQSVEWNIAQVRADQVWSDFGITGRGVVVANMDTGADWTHPALQSKYRGSDGDHNYNWYDYTDTYPDAPGDGDGHGTHTMGTIVGDDGGTNQIGMAPGAHWIAVKIFDDFGFTDDVKIHQGFQWFLAPTDLNGENPDPSKAPDVVNNSWGSFNGADPTFWHDVAAWQAASIFPVFAAGNDGEMGHGSVDSPGSFPQAVAVGATDSEDAIASFSGRGPSFWEEVKPEVSAPGV
ncbi:MAG: S8 family serine peptidase, partial [bacterium]